MKKGNSVILLLGGVHACSANHDIREFKVRVYNSVDMLPVSVRASMDELNVDSGVLDNTGLEKILCDLRNHICVCYHASGVDAVLKEEDS